VSLFNGKTNYDLLFEKKAKIRRFIPPNGQKRSMRAENAPIKGFAPTKGHGYSVALF
jgi:hypothetical protein